MPRSIGRAYGIPHTTRCWSEALPVGAVADHRLRLEVLGEPVGAPLAAVARPLVPAERRVEIDRRAVEMDVAGAQPAGDRTRLLVLPRHIAGQAIRTVVGDPHGVVDV